MDNSNYVIDQNGSWDSPEEALEWYRKEVDRLRGNPSISAGGPSLRLDETHGVEKVSSVVETSITKASIETSKLLGAAQDKVISEALDRVLGHGKWTLSDIKPRVTVSQLSGRHSKSFLLDGKPIVEIFPAETSWEDNKDPLQSRFNAEFKYRFLP